MSLVRKARERIALAFVRAHFINKNLHRARVDLDSSARQLIAALLIY